MSKNFERLENISKIISGKNAPKEEMFNYNEGLPFVRASHLNNLLDRNFNYELIPKISNDVNKKLKLNIAPKNSLLFAKSGMSATMNRIIKLKQDCYFVNHLACVISKEEILDSDFLKHYLFYYNPSNLIQGEAYPSINLGVISTLEIPLPPLSTQKAIAEKLDKADALRKKDAELLAQYDELAQSIFIDMFGDPLKNEKEFDSKSLEEVSHKITDGTHDTPQRLTEGIKFITGKHIKPFFIDYENSDYVTEEVHSEIYRRCNPELGDILYTNIGVNYATAAMNIVDYEFSMKNVALIKYDRTIFNGRYLEYLLNDEHFKGKLKSRFGVGGAQQFLSLTQIKSIRVYIPPISLQNQFAEKIKNIEAQKALVKKQAAASENLFQALLQESFSF